jgi:hypothetical protein
MNVGWKLDAATQTLTVTLQAKLSSSRSEYMAFGLSGSSTRQMMDGGDVVVASVSEDGTAIATDYHLGSKGACSGSGNGVCPDSVINAANSNDVTVVSGGVSDGVTTVVYTRPYAASDAGTDKAINAEGSNQVICA